MLAIVVKPTTPASLSSRGKVSHASPTGSFTLNFGTLPILEVTYVGTIDDATFQRYLDDLASVLSVRQPYVLLADATRSGAPTAKQRRMQADLIREHFAGFERYCAGAAFVIESALIRGALTAILWAQKLPYEHTVVGTREDALAWLTPRVARN
jgi:hypothetical protein